MLTVWLDNQFSAELARWLERELPCSAACVRDLGLARADDLRIFMDARSAQATILTKDADFIALIQRLGPPPQIVWLHLGNRSDAALKRLLAPRLTAIRQLLEEGDAFIEVRDAP